MSRFTTFIKNLTGIAGRASQKINTAKNELEKDLSSSIETNAKPGAKAQYRFDYLHDGVNAFKRLIRLQRVIIILIIALVPFYLSTHIRENQFFPTSSEGRVIPNVALTEPNIGDSSLVSWVSRAATESLNMGFHDYNRRLRESSRHYTRRGWAEFTKFLNEENIFRALKTQNALISSQPNIAPIIQNEGVQELPNGQKRYFWELKLAMQVVYVQGVSRSSEYETIIRVVRVPKLESGLGISIDEWIPANRR